MAMETERVRMSNSETTITTSTDAGANPPPQETVLVGGTTDRSALDEATLGALDRVNNLEHSVSGLTGRVEGVENGQTEIRSEISSLGDSMKQGLAGLQSTIANALGGAKETAQSAVSAVTEPAKEIVEDIAPTIKEHAFFRPWGKRS